MQRRAAQIMGGAFRTTAGAALDVELNLPPIEESMKKALSNSLFRLASTPIYAHVS